MDLLLSVTLFVAIAIAFVLGSLVFGHIVRPRLPNTEKGAVYECGEPPVGSSWVQFDLRFYIVALFYLVFDVEVALTYPWAVVFRNFPLEAIVYGAPFVGLIVVGYAYEWNTGSLDWVRSAVTTAVKGAAGTDVAALARRDPEALEEERAHSH